MRAILTFLFCLSLACPAFSAEINCYSGKTRIYHGFGNNFVFSDSIVSFVEYKTNHIILINGDCIVLTPSDGEKFNAIDLRKEIAFA